jgi:anaerobic C4-dicarboxylate transporter
VCGKSVCGQFLIRSILVLLFSFEVPPKKNYQKKLQQKKKKKAKRNKKATTKKGLCVCFHFFCAVVICDYLGVQARISSTV